LPRDFRSIKRTNPIRDALSIRNRNTQDPQSRRNRPSPRRTRDVLVRNHLETTTLGTTEIWQIENLVGMDHPFHLHGFSFQVLDRNGEPEPYASWQDTVNVPAHSMVRFAVRFEDYPGKWMFHCHILDHESAGMMGILEVR
jgi:FtsP/CotA-like multicopper oxidase with cupredoxin domain